MFTETAEAMKNSSRPFTYISLFSNAGIGCYGFKQEGFECIATNEILEERLKLQTFNNKCKYESGYICGDITLENTKNKIYGEIELWKKEENMPEVDIVIATPPCQGMSVANLKKKNELKRNSLVVESIKLVKEIQPKIFIFENVRSFLTTQCSDIDGSLRPIKEAIDLNLSNYHILHSVIDFKHYGNPSQRTRALVIGTRKDLSDVTPYDLFPVQENPITLEKAIGHLRSLKKIGEIDKDDIFLNFRPYPERMLSWLKDLGEGQSAFDNKDIRKKPHQIINGQIVINKQKNGDKYKRCFWGKPGYCVHTRNDLLASQMTIHPNDNRVFSIRELIILMSIPYDFQWSNITTAKLNKLIPEEKRLFLKREELNIRRTIGESVPTIIFRKIAANAKKLLSSNALAEQDIKKIITKNKLDVFRNLCNFVRNNLSKYSYQELSKIAELANSSRLHNAAYYTPQDICYSIIKDLPDFKKQDVVRILEPSVGLGNFIPLLFKKYGKKNKVVLDVVDVDPNSIKLLKLLLKKIVIPPNFKINFIVNDFLLKDIAHSSYLDNSDSKLLNSEKYDVVVGNPPFKKIINNKNLLNQYKQHAYNKSTNNIFSYFIEKALGVGKAVSLIAPKTLLSAPEFNKTRELMSRHAIYKICDYGEKAFKIKIETISFTINTGSCQRKREDISTKIESYITRTVKYQLQKYICDKTYPYWLIYRDVFFDSIAQQLNFDIFTAFRDRQITNSLLDEKGKYRVLKSRNIGAGTIINKSGYDCYINNIDRLNVRKFLNTEKAVLIPNLTYSPRACFLPKNTITDGSVAIALPKNGDNITNTDLKYYSTNEFRKFYAIARNVASRTMNIDSNSIFFFGKLKKEKS